MSSMGQKLIAITGAASGIGLATARLLAARGASLSLADINKTGLNSLVDSLRASHSNPKIAPTQQRFLAQPLDVRDATATRDWMARTMDTFDGQPLDGAANLAGIIGGGTGVERGTIRNVADEEWQRIWSINVGGVWNCLRAQLPVMRVGRGGKGGGSIVNAASAAGLMGVASSAPYAASKHAVVGLTKSAAKEEGRTAIRVNAIAPGAIDTPLLRQIERTIDIPDLAGERELPGALRRKGEAEEVAELIYFLISDRSSFVNGMVYGIDGGLMC